MRALLYVAVALAAGCGGNKEQAPAAGSSAAAPPPTAPPPAALEVFVDDASVARVTTAQLAQWPRLDMLIPPAARRLGTWQVVALKGAKPQPVELMRPSSSYPDMVPAVFPGEGGAPAFGMFDPVELARRGKPALREDALREIRIKLSANGRGTDHQGGDGGADPLKLVVAIQTPAGDRALTGEQLLALPRDPMPGSDDTRGWRLTTLLKAAAIDRFERLVLVDASGVNLVLARSDFDDRTVVPFIKLNKQGALRFRVYKQVGDGWEPGADLRALATIRVAK